MTAGRAGPSGSDADERAIHRRVGDKCAGFIGAMCIDEENRLFDGWTASLPVNTDMLGSVFFVSL